MGDEMVLIQPSRRDNPVLCMVVALIGTLLGVFSYCILPAESMYITIGCLLIIALLITAPRFGLYASILILPVCWGPLMNTPMLGIPGLKISVILPLLAVLYLTMVYKPRKLDHTEYAFFFSIFIIFSIAVFRSYSYLAQKSIRDGNELSMVNHFMTNYLRPLLLFCFTIVLASYLRTERQMKQVMKVLMGSMVIGFAYLIFYVSGNASSDFEMLRTIIQEAVGMHPGYYANYFVVMVPITLLLAIRMHWRICYGILGIELISIALTFSRASYLVTIVSVFAVLLLCKKYFVIGGIILTFPFLVSILPNIIVNRALTGLAERDLSVISAGRVESIWKPLLQEIAGDFGMLLFGNGRYGIFRTNVYQMGAVFSVNNAHNILLDMVCDGGIVALFIFVLFFMYYLKKFWIASRKSSNVMDSCILSGTCIGVGAFLVKGMTDGVFWAESSNAMIYVLLGISIAVIYRNKEKREYIRQTQKN